AHVWRIGCRYQSVVDRSVQFKYKRYLIFHLILIFAFAEARLRYGRWLQQRPLTIQRMRSAAVEGPKHPHTHARLLAFLALALSVLLVGCDGSDGSGGAAPGPNVQLSGRVTYDFVPVVASATPRDAYLDYGGTVARPARGVQVAAIDDEGRELAAGQADADGRYVLTVPKNTQIRLRAIARLYQAPGAGASWDFSIRDNTSPGYADNQASIYAVQGEAFNTGVMHLVRDLHAASGWTGDGYGNTRSAAPFAILDQIFSAMQKVLAVDEDAVFAPMKTYWSVANRSSAGDKSKGEIGTSHWSPGEDHQGLYILGKEDLDTDEYD